MLELPSKEVLKHVVDVHCHPTDSQITPEAIDDLPIIICAMATRQSDQALVANLARARPEKIVPCFGFHPWFAHWISVTPGPSPSKEEHYRSLFLSSSTTSDNEGESTNREQSQAFEEMLPSLPEPLAIEECISSLRENFTAFPQAMLGEVGIDKSARVPIDHRSEKRSLTPFTVPFEHQITVLEAQLDLAVEMKRNVSLHSVKSQKATVDLFNRMKSKHGKAWMGISIDLHSCGLSPETWRDIEKSHANAFLSLSTVINERSPAHRKLISMASPNRLLVESDIHEIHQCVKRTWDMLSIVAEVKGWKVEDKWDEELEESQWGVVRKLEHNFEVFMKGDHDSQPSVRSKRKK